MILPINIDLNPLVEEFDLTLKQTSSLGSILIDRIMEEYSSKWENIINETLTKSRNEYKRGMYVDRVSATEVVFGLENRESSLPLMIEEGTQPFDEKLGFAKSTKVKLKKDGGWYLTIPFRHGTPTAVASSGIFSSIMSKEVYNIAKNNGGMSVKKVQLPIGDQTLGSRKEIKTTNLVVPEYMHKSAKYEGLVRINIGSGNENRGGYFTFRRVSNNSNPNSWWNGGIVPHKLMDKALELAQVDKVADMVIDQFLNENL